MSACGLMDRALVFGTSCGGSIPPRRTHKMNTKPPIHNLVICANVIVRMNGKYLFMKRSKNKIDAPGYIHPFGGKIDLNENPYVGAVREVKEEVGIEIENLKLEAVVLEIQPDKEKPENWLIFYFIADYKSGKMLATDEGEAVFLDKQEILSSHLFPSLKKVIKDILNPNDGTVFVTNKYTGFESGLQEITKNICVTK